MDGETVYVPSGLNLVVDIDESPKLNLVLVEGSLTFLPNSNPEHQRKFHAHYIYVHGGSMEVGTEEFPYTSKITITMYGALADPYIPIYGNKVIGVRFGTLDMHGVPRTPSWTYLAYTVKKGDTRIVMNTAVDWKAGEMIALASTSYDPHAAEK